MATSYESDLTDTRLSRQFSFYLLLSDIESLVAELRLRVGIRMIQTPSQSLKPVELNSPMSHRSPRKPDAVSVWCGLTAASGADIRMKFYPTQSHWIVTDASEVIEFSGCEYDGNTLAIGRFYYQNDMLIDGTIWPKRKEFIEWADRVFRTTKKLLHRSKALDAYIGEGAAKWRLNGGQFVSGFRQAGEPVHAVDE